MTHWPARPARQHDLGPAARLWRDAWHEAHAAHVPAELTRLRTLTDFEHRLHAMGDRLRVAGPAGAPLGLCATATDELDQLFVAPDARGTGLAARLLADGEARRAAAGTMLAFLDFVIENRRAAAFYRRRGWRYRETTEMPLDTAAGSFFLRVLVFEKRLALMA